MDGRQKTALNPIAQRGHPLPSEETTRMHPRLSETACEKCRDQKVSHLFHWPGPCTHVHGQQLDCYYPAPPNRKWLAAVRKPPRPRNPSSRRQRHVERQSPLAPEYLVPGAAAHPQQGLESLQERGSAPSNQDAAAPVTASKTESSLCFMDRSGVSASPDLLNSPRMNQTGCRGASAPGAGPSRDSLPCRAIGLSLLEIYFERIYNAHLLFDKSRFFEDYLQRKLPDFLLKAVFALASLFLREVPPDSIRSSESTELAVLSMFYEKGMLWATEASEKVLPLATAPSLLTTQALECLTIFWFATGDTIKADIHSNPAPENQECERRCFWSTWATMCLAVRPPAFGLSAWMDAADLPLPGPWGQHGPGVLSVPRQKMDVNWSCASSGDARTPDDTRASLLAELMKILGVWAKVQTVARQPFKDLDDAEVTRLANIATSIYQSESFPRHKQSPVSESESLELVVLLHALYHLSQIVLESSRVPLFSGHQSNPQIPQEVVKRSAEAVLQHAKWVACLLSDYLTVVPDMTKLCPVVGFAAFVAGWVFVMCAQSQQRRNMNLPDVKVADSIWTGPIMQLLNTLQIYFQPLVPLTEQLRSELPAAGQSTGPSKVDNAEGSQTPHSGPNSTEEVLPFNYPCILVIADKYVPVPPSKQKDRGVPGTKVVNDADNSATSGSTAGGLLDNRPQPLLVDNDMPAQTAETEMPNSGFSPVDTDWSDFIGSVADFDYSSGNGGEFQPIFSFLS
ncbi:hypothetical protein PCL_04498 [Purpureocillium lilacinum]|uniref:Transcription factor domain-containing protein n=1 Tax=Purpureocillium lilacinum TaxID=33203 RepID=A0A2U3DXM4_PURLI|nr:hypothetical protein PCL_04498 [Purpureocillium lilacinum]